MFLELSEVFLPILTFSKRFCQPLSSRLIKIEFISKSQHMFIWPWFPNKFAFLHLADFHI